MKDFINELMMRLTDSEEADTEEGEDVRDLRPGEVIIELYFSALVYMRNITAIYRTPYAWVVAVTVRVITVSESVQL